MNELKIFENEQFGRVRTINENDKVLFCGSDIAKALGYDQPHKAIDRHCRYSTKRTIPHPQSINKEIEMFFIPEGDVYRLITHSKLPAAEQFEKWVFDEVLPSIRKHGVFAIDEMLNNPDALIAALTEYKAERQKRLESEKARVEAERQRDILIHTQKTFTSTELAKELGLKSAQDLNRKLSEMGIQFKQNRTWVLYSKYADMGYTEIKQQVLDNGNIVYDRRWTGCGRDFIMNKLKQAI